MNRVRGNLHFAQLFRAKYAVNSEPRLSGRSHSPPRFLFRFSSANRVPTMSCRDGAPGRAGKGRPPPSRPFLSHPLFLYFSHPDSYVPFSVRLGVRARLFTMHQPPPPFSLGRDTAMMNRPLRGV